MTSAKATIVTLLTTATYKVAVNDDGAANPTPPPALNYTALTGEVLDHWPGKQDLATNDWIITVGPVVGADAQLSSIGALSKWIRESVQIDVWVMEKRDQNWAAERVRGDLVQDVDRCLHHFASSPGTGFKVVNLEAWRELDETGLKRTCCTASMEYEKAQA